MHLSLKVGFLNFLALPFLASQTDLYLRGVLGGSKISDPPAVVADLCISAGSGPTPPPGLYGFTFTLPHTFAWN